MTQQARRENQDDFHNPKRAGGILFEKSANGDKLDGPQEYKKIDVSGVF